MIRSSAAALILLAVLLAPAAANAQITPLQEELAEATAVDCHFTSQVMSDWDGSDTLFETQPADLDVSFSNVNADEGTADAGTNFGDALIVVRYASDYLHLLQMFRTGPLYVTTVLAYQNDDDRFLAVHTRHEYTALALPGFTARPEMYIGDCEIVD